MSANSDHCFRTQKTFNELMNSDVKRKDVVWEAHRRDHERSMKLAIKINNRNFRDLMCEWLVNHYAKQQQNAA